MAFVSKHKEGFCGQTAYIEVLRAARCIFAFSLPIGGDTVSSLPRNQMPLNCNQHLLELHEHYRILNCYILRKLMSRWAPSNHIQSQPVLRPLH